MDKNKIDINIGGQTYTLLTDESPAAAKALADRLNKRLAAVTGKGRISLTQALVLVSLELLQEADAQREAAQNLKSQIGDYLEDAERAMTERDHYKREYDKLLEKTKPQS